MWNNISSRVLTVCIICLGLSAGDADAANGLKSAYLGESVWDKGLSSQEVNQQLREHFVEVIDQLEKKHASSLLTALLRAETTSAKPWTKSDRRAALIYLAHNRQKQIESTSHDLHESWACSRSIKDRRVRPSQFLSIGIKPTALSVI